MIEGILTRRYGTVLLLASAMAGCASTRMTSQVNHEVVRGGFGKIMVYGGFASLEHRQLAERGICSELQRRTVTECVESAQVFFPGAEYSQEEIADRLTALRFDGVIVLQPVGAGTSATYIPPTTRTTGSATVYGNTISGSSSTRTSGGYNVDKPWANYEIVLWAVRRGEMAWYATASSGGNAFAGWDDLVRSAASKTASQLLSDGVLRKR